MCVAPFSLGRFTAHLVVPNELVVEIVAYAEKRAPEEVCGWIGGRGNRAVRTYPVPARPRSRGVTSKWSRRPSSVPCTR